MNLNLFNKKNISNGIENKNNNLITSFLEELKNALISNKNEDVNINNELDEYNLYEKRKLFLDNKSRNGNKLAWVMDNNSVCISEHGDGGPYSISEIDLPEDVNVGEVYEQINDRYVYNKEITEEINKIK